MQAALVLPTTGVWLVHKKSTVPLGKSPTATDLHKELNALKKTDYPWMYEVSKCAPQESLRDLEKAYKHFYRKLKLKAQGTFRGKIGFPTFKKRSHGIGSFRLTGSIKVFADGVQLPRLGRLRLHEHGYLPTDAKVLSATVSEQAGRWYVSVQVEQEQENPVCVATSAIGVDLGIKTLATFSDGTTVENPRALKHAQKKLRRLEKQKSRRKKGCKNRAKTCKRIAKTHARVAHIRLDASHKLTSYLCKNHALIAIEDLHVSGMLKNHCLAGAVEWEALVCQQWHTKLPAMKQEPSITLACPEMSKKWRTVCSTSPIIMRDYTYLNIRDRL